MSASTCAISGGAKIFFFHAIRFVKLSSHMLKFIFTIYPFKFSISR